MKSGSAERLKIKEMKKRKRTKAMNGVSKTTKRPQTKKKVKIFLFLIQITIIK